MADLAVMLGEGISSAHIAHVKHVTQQEPRSLKMYKGTPTIKPALFGKGASTLYVCGHGNPGSLGGVEPQDLLTTLFCVGLDSSKYNTIFLFSCSAAAHIAHQQGYNGKTFAQTFYDLCQKSTVFKGVTVKAFLGVLHFDKEERMNQAPKITGQCVILPNGQRKPVVQGMVTLSPSGGAYVPPAAI